MANSRRDFLGTASALAVGAGLSAILPAPAFSRSPADKIRIGAIGVNGMGWADLNAILKNADTTCVALCDVDQNVLAKRLPSWLRRA